MIDGLIDCYDKSLGFFSNLGQLLSVTIIAWTRSPPPSPAPPSPPLPSLPPPPPPSRPRPPSPPPPPPQKWKWASSRRTSCGRRTTWREHVRRRIPEGPSRSNTTNSRSQRRSESADSEKFTGERALGSSCFFFLFFLFVFFFVVVSLRLLRSSIFLPLLPYNSLHHLPPPPPFPSPPHSSSFLLPQRHVAG